ncbi:MAG: pyruvate kinase, partial [candidate division WOR-3 bacterium]
ESLRAQTLFDDVEVIIADNASSDGTDQLARELIAGLPNVMFLPTGGDHGFVVACNRAAERATGRRVAILADLPGPKMRLGRIEPEPIQLQAGQKFTLTSEPIIGQAQRVSMSFARLPQVVKPGDRLFLNDGLVQLVVERVTGADVHCMVVVGGELRSKKGLNLPGIELGISAFTDHDRACLEFALQHGVDAVSQSFVERAADLEAVRAAARTLGRQPFLIAKIERAGALQHFDEILQAADGIMIARGDLGVEVPIEQMAIMQKQLIARASLAGKPVITATQMLESMTTSRLPTRAEATDVANAILDGADCLMLSGESAMGRYPVEAVKMLASIAAATESQRPATRLNDLRAAFHQHKPASSSETAFRSSSGGPFLSSHEVSSAYLGLELSTYARNKNCRSPMPAETSRRYTSGKVMPLPTNDMRTIMNVMPRVGNITPIMR